MFLQKTILNAPLAITVGAVPVIIAGGGDALVRQGFSVDEDQMFVRFRFSAPLSNSAAAQFRANFVLDGVIIHATPVITDNLDALGGIKNVAFEFVQKVARGKHVVTVFAAVTVANSIFSAAEPAFLTVERITNAGTLAQVVHSKTLSGGF